MRSRARSESASRLAATFVCAAVPPSDRIAMSKDEAFALSALDQARRLGYRRHSRQDRTAQLLRFRHHIVACGAAADCHVPSGLQCRTPGARTPPTPAAGMAYAGHTEPCYSHRAAEPARVPDPRPEHYVDIAASTGPQPQKRLSVIGPLQKSAQSPERSLSSTCAYSWTSFGCAGRPPPP